MAASDPGRASKLGLTRASPALPAGDDSSRGGFPAGVMQAAAGQVAAHGVDADDPPGRVDRPQLMTIARLVVRPFAGMADRPGSAVRLM